MYFDARNSLLNKTKDEFRLDLLNGTDKSLNYDSSNCDEEEQRYYSSDDEKKEETIEEKLERREFVARTKTKYVCTLLDGYFKQLKKRLPLVNLTYLNLMEFGEEDFGVFGKRLEDYLQNCGKIMENDKIGEYQNLLKQYFEFIPNELLKLRERLLEIYDQMESEKKCKCPIDDYRMVTYQEIDRGKLAMEIVQTTTNAQQKIDHFIRRIRLTDESKIQLGRLIAILNEALQNSPLSELAPKLYPFGSYLNEIAAYDCDLDIVIKFEAFESLDLLDYETGWLALAVIRRTLERKLGFNLDYERSLVPSRRCPIINLDFGLCLEKDVTEEVRKRNQTLSQKEQIKFKKIDLSIRSLYSYYNSKLVQFLAKFDHRFYEMTMILKYWAKENIGLIGRGGICSYALSLMIVFFLQNTEPRILPPVNELQELARKHPEKFPAIKIHEYSFEFCDDLSMIDKSTNTKCTSDLICDFIAFYRKISHEYNAISPRTGEKVSKEELHKNTRYAAVQSDISSLFRMSSVTIQDPFVDTNNVGSSFQKYQHQTWNQGLGVNANRVNPQNCLWMLIREVGQKLPGSKARPRKRY